MPGFTLKSTDDSLVFTSRFDESSPKVIGGGPRWGKVEIPHDKSVTEWAGRDPMSVQIGFLLDNWGGQQGGQGVPIERMCRILEKMCGIDAGDPPPPVLIVIGDPPGCIPHDFHDWSKGRWFIETLEWADGALRNSAGNRVRAGGSLTITEFNRGSLLGAKSASRVKTYTVKAGDTLSRIAAKFDTTVKKLKEKNDIRDPNKIRVGQVLRIP